MSVSYTDAATDDLRQGLANYLASTLPDSDLHSVRIATQPEAESESVDPVEFLFGVVEGDGFALVRGENSGYAVQGHPEDVEQWFVEEVNTFLGSIPDDIDRGMVAEYSAGGPSLREEFDVPEGEISIQEQD